MGEGRKGEDGAWSWDVHVAKKRRNRNDRV